MNTTDTKWKPMGRRPAQPKKPTGHEAFLKMLEASGAKIQMVMSATGQEIEGVVKHSDAYTISVKVDGRGTRVFFKHAIESFEPIDPAPESKAE